MGRHAKEKNSMDYGGTKQTYKHEWKRNVSLSYLSTSSYQNPSDNAEWIGINSVAFDWETK